MKRLLPVGFVLAVVLISGCTQTGGGGKEVNMLKSFTSPSGDLHKTPNQEIFEPVTLLTNEQNTRMQLQFELLERPTRGDKIKLTLEDGLEYVSGPFTKSGNEYFIFVEQDTIPAEETVNSFVIQVNEKGKFVARLTVLDENNQFVETRFINFCVGDNTNQAVALCTNPGCQTKECIEQRVKSRLTTLD